jgi:hypothetical protein
MTDRQAITVNPKPTVFAVMLLVLASCGATTPCSDADPVGPCATSHSQTHGG